MEFIITKHALQRYKEKFYDGTPMIEVVRQAKLANDIEEIAIRTQYQDVRGHMKRILKYQKYFVYNDIIFACKQESKDEVVVVTCWAKEESVWPTINIEPPIKQHRKGRAKCRYQRLINSLDDLNKKILGFYDVQEYIEKVQSWTTKDREEVIKLFSIPETDIIKEKLRILKEHSRNEDGLTARHKKLIKWLNFYARLELDDYDFNLLLNRVKDWPDGKEIVEILDGERNIRLLIKKIDDFFKGEKIG